MEKKKSIDKLNELAIRDIDTLKHVKEEEIDFIEYIAKGCSQEVPRLYDRVPPIIKYNRGNEELIRIVLDYYRTLDSEMYEQAKSIIMGQNDIPIAIYNKKDITRKRGQVEKELSGYGKFEEGSKILWGETPGIFLKNTTYYVDSAKIYVSRKENDYDIYTLAHEISHTFDRDLEDISKTSDLLAEITPACIEEMLSRYLEKKRIMTPNGILRRRTERAKSIYIDSITTYTRMQLVKIFKKNGRLEKDDIKRIEQENNMSDNQMKWVLSYLLDEKSSIYYISKYIIADLISTPYFGKMYDEDSGKAIKMLKDFFKEMKYGSPESSLEALGISSKKDIDSLIKQKAEYNRELHNANVKPKNMEREER